MFTDAPLKESLQRAALAVAIVFSVAVIIAVSDPRPSGSTNAESERAHTSGRRFPPPIPPTPNVSTQRQPAVAIEAPPTAVPEPTQTLLEVVAASVDLAGLEPAVVPAGECNSWVTLDSGDLPTTFSCDAGAVVAVATGRVLMAHTGPSPIEEPSPIAAPWSWSRGLSLGNFVVIDHGPTDSANTVISVYSRLTDIDPLLTRGATVEVGQRVGGLGVEGQASTHTFGWELWVNDSLPGISVPPVPPSADDALFEATEISASSVTLPAPANCPFPNGDRLSLPNSARVYRSGVHQGIDFGCGAPGANATAFSPGRVVMIVSDITEPTPSDRNALLENAALAGDTPHWTLTHLYGNFVVLDHGELADVGRVMTVYAHLASVDPGLTLGQNVNAGQVIGEIGDSGTSSAAEGTTELTPEKIHLHWEIHIDDHYLGEGLSAAATEQVYRSLLCRATDAFDCTER